jgi:hypothetical protein
MHSTLGYKTIEEFEIEMYNQKVAAWPLSNCPLFCCKSNKRNGNTDREEYFDKELYDERYALERTNAWMDSFRSLLNRFDTTIESWKGFNYLAFIVIALKKFNRKKKKKFKPLQR